MIGEKFNRLTVIAEAEKLRYKNQTVKRFLCQCECGNEKVIIGAHIRNGKIKSCGCYNVEVATERGRKQMERHGNYYHPLWQTYTGMLRRCYNEKREDYKWYGGRGIKVDDVWLGNEGFDNFVRDMGPKPDLHYSIDRLDVDKNYGAENCRWSTPKEQANNRRNNI